MNRKIKADWENNFHLALSEICGCDAFMKYFPPLEFTTIYSSLPTRTASHGLQVDPVILLLIHFLACDTLQIEE